MAEYTTSTALLEALVSAGISHLFVNLGSDHPAILEAVSKRILDGKTDLRILTAPNEFVGLCAAQGFFQVSGQMQAIIVHVDAGTLAMAGAIHNVSRARIPVLMLAGTSPMTDEGELVGTRNEFIHSLQDTIDQRGIVRGYTVYDHEIRSGLNVKQIVLRAAQFARSEPQGPAYLIASREVLCESLTPYEVDAKKWKPVAPPGLTPSVVEEISQAVLRAEAPLLITTYLGRDPEAVKELVAFCEATGMGVLEALPSCMNFPREHDLYLGNHWSQSSPGSALHSADLILVLDCDVPWVKTAFAPRDDALIYHIDCDPIKVNMSLFHIDTELSCQANSKAALQQLNAFVKEHNGPEDASSIREKTKACQEKHAAYVASIDAKIKSENLLTPHYALSRLQALLGDDQYIILNEGISNYQHVVDVFRSVPPGHYFTSGATALGWHGGAAIGCSLASPNKTIISITGDGSFMFSLPETVHWMARRYNAPFLTIILNNRGWKSPMLSTLAVYEEGHSSKVTSDDLNVTLDPPCNHAQVAVASGAGFGATVKEVDELDAALTKALETVRGGRAAVVDVHLPKYDWNRSG